MNRKTLWRSALLLLIPLLGTVGVRAAVAVDRIDIPYQKFVLPNGLTLLVHEDHKAPIVAFNVWYHVGSKNEKAGRTGFAHLFEHLMFNGSENYNDDYFKPMQKIGATDLNGTTSEDRTNYFENVPTPALDVALWMESDRMGHLIGALDQAKLDEQRGVVQNEKRQGDNEPYSVAEEMIARACFPAGHPYSWTVIGSLEDLSAAKLEDVHGWFRSYYGPNNAVVVLAGDIDPKTALEKVTKYFGDIPANAPIARQGSWIAKRTGTHREYVQDRVPQARVMKIWNIPPWGDETATRLDLVSDLLSMGKSSRLYKRLVYDEQIATRVSAFTDLREIAGLFAIEADVKPGVDPARVERAIDEEMAKFLASGPTAAELVRVKTSYLASFIRGIERIGGFGGKSDILARAATFTGDPEHYKKILGWVEKTTAANLQKAASEWLTDGAYLLQVTPYPQLTTQASTVDRKQLPVPGAAPEVKFPAIQRATLSNGLKVVLAERHAVPLVNFSLLVDAGYAADQFGLPGTAALTLNMLQEGTQRRTSLQISDELAALGARLNAGSNLDASLVSLSTLTANLVPALDLYADVILHPAFPERDFQRQQKLQISRIQNEKTSPSQMALRVLPGILYGSGHAYGNPLTGTGNEESVAKLTRADLEKFHNTWFKPNNATLVVVGDVTMGQIKPKLEALFQGWRSGDVPQKNLAPVAEAKAPAIYIMDKPGAPQSVVIGGLATLPAADADDLATSTMNFILGGDFVSRINMNIRENKHWSYGARSMFISSRGQQPFVVFAPVQGDKTAETVTELLGEMKGILSEKPITEAEFANAQASLTLSLPGEWETAAAIQNSLAEMVNFGRPDDYYATQAQRIRSLTQADLLRAAQRTIHPSAVQWLIVGDRQQIEPKLRALGLGEIHIVDSDGKIVK